MPKNGGKKSSSTHTRELLHACVFLLAIASASAFGTRVKDFFKKKTRRSNGNGTSLSQPYVKLAGSQCLGAAIKGVLIKGSLADAKRECDARGLGCSGVYDVACDGVGHHGSIFALNKADRYYYLCKDGMTFGKSEESSAGKNASCVYAKHTQCALQHGALHTATDPIRAEVWRLTASATKHIQTYIHAQLKSNLDFHRLCVAIMGRHHNTGGACGGTFVLRNTLTTPSQERDILKKETPKGFFHRMFHAAKNPNKNVTFNCKKGLPKIYSVMDLCTAPCMDRTQNTGKCCVVPAEAAKNFACCREAGCCLDQTTGHKRRRRARGVRLRHPRKMPGVEVTAGVEVEESASSRSTFDQLMSCLRQPGKTPLACNMDAPWVVAADAPTGAPTTPATTG